MTRGLKIASTSAMAGLLLIAAARDAGAWQGTAGPFRVRVVDARQQGVPSITVDVTTPGLAHESYTTGRTGLAAIARQVAVEGAVLTVKDGDKAIAWATIGDRSRSAQEGTPGNPMLMELIPLTHKVEGTVVDPQGKPIGGVRIGVQGLYHRANRRMEQDLSRKDPLLGFVESDSSGKFALNLPEGAHASLRPLHPRHVGPFIPVTPSDRSLRPAVLLPAGRIVGTVTDAATGKPLAGATVAAQLLERRPILLTDGWGQSATDAQGRFEIPGLEPGVYNLLLIEVPGRRHATATAVEGVRVEGGSEATASLSAIEGRPLRGVVIDRATGRPMADAQVGCQGTAVPPSGPAIMGTTTDEKGRFTFHVPPGEQFVYLIDDIASSRMGRRVVVVPEQGEVIPLALLQPPAQDSESVPPPPRDGAAIEPDGPGVNEGVAPVAAPAPAIAIVDVAVPPPVVEPPPPVAVAVALPPVAPAPVAAVAAKAVETRTVTGRVRDAKGRPIAGLRVAQDIGPARRGNLRDPFGSVATDREGKFVLRGLRRNPVSIVVSRPRYQVQSEVIPADRDEVELTYRLQPDEKARNQAALIEDESIPPEVRPRLTFVDLTPYGTNYLTDGPAIPGDGNNLDRLPRGVHKLADSYFQIGEKMVQVKGQVSPNWPESVAGIKVAARGKKLHILHATEQQTEPGTELGHYVIHYADGSKEKIPIVYGRNLVDWWHFPSQKNDPSDARIAWTGGNDMVDGRKGEDLKIRLFAFTWTNPHPDREIAAIDVVSANSACDPYLIALTLEREK